jgi:preprotein translocase subunit SecA
MNEFFEKLLSFGGSSSLKKLAKVAARVNSLEDTFTILEDEDIALETEALKERYEIGESLDSLMPESFALVREATNRALGMRHFDVQVMGAAALHYRSIAEIKTGEGKTLVAIMAAYLNALSGKSVHIVTVNEYLATYQSELMRKVFEILGMSVGCLLASHDMATKKKQYDCDVIYGTSSEFGFDYLRDNLSQLAEEQVQQGHGFVIIDEIDSILIDESRTPLIVSGAGNADEVRWYQPLARLARGFVEGTDYDSDYKKKAISISPSAIAKVEERLSLTNLYSAENSFLVGAVQNAIKAKALYLRDKDYVVTREGVEIVDENTGRVLEGRRYSDGLHQAIEAKEGIAIQPEDQTLASVTLQNYFRLYDKMSGMTGTGKTEASEFYSIYQTPIVEIPTNEPNIRVDYADLVFRTEREKFAAVVEEIKKRHSTGQPILVGTSSVLNSELLSRLLKKAGVSHNMLNAKDDTRESEIIAQAGRLGAVTVSTNMAGRGTDIMLGGNAEMLAVAEQKRHQELNKNNPNNSAPNFGELLTKYKEESQLEANNVKALGGLFVLGTERHESKRIDNQLRGRAARQGDPGESQFLISLEDEIIRRFGSMLPGTASKIGVEGTSAEEISKIFSKAQRAAEVKNQEERKDLIKFDNIVNTQRINIYQQRQTILDGADLSEKSKDFISTILKGIVTDHLGNKQIIVGSEDLELLWKRLEEIYPISLTIEEVIDETHNNRQADGEWLSNEINSDALIIYSRREEDLGEDVAREIERGVILSAIDTHWQHHINNMSVLLESIHYQAYAQVDPVEAYRREGVTFYKEMLEDIQEEVVSLIFKVDAESSQAFLRGITKITLQQPSIFTLNDSRVQRKQLPTGIDYDGNLVETEFRNDGIGSIPMNRADRRAAAKNKGNPKNR